jgi:hypothetical protein
MIILVRELGTSNDGGVVKVEGGGGGGLRRVDVRHFHCTE